MGRLLPLPYPIAASERNSHLGQIADFALAAYRENTNFVFGNHEAVQGDVSGMAKRNNQLA